MSLSQQKYDFDNDRSDIFRGFGQQYTITNAWIEIVSRTLVFLQAAHKMNLVMMGLKEYSLNLTNSLFMTKICRYKQKKLQMITSLCLQIMHECVSYYSIDYCYIKWLCQAPGHQLRCLLINQFHMFLTIWSCTTTIGLPEFYIRVHLKVTYVWCKIQEAQSNDLLHTARSLMHLDTPLHGNNARGTKYAMYYASVVMHTVSENIKWLHSRCVRIKKAQLLPLLVYSLIVYDDLSEKCCHFIMKWC